jgi:hypothetical protein
LTKNWIRFFYKTITNYNHTNRVASPKSEQSGKTIFIRVGTYVPVYFSPCRRLRRPTQQWFLLATSHGGTYIHPIMPADDYEWVIRSYSIRVRYNRNRTDMLKYSYNAIQDYALSNSITVCKCLSAALKTLFVLQLVIFSLGHCTSETVHVHIMRNCFQNDTNAKELSIKFSGPVQLRTPSE